MTTTLRNPLVWILTGIIMISIFATVAHANPSFFTTNQTATATTTPSYLALGSGTTTLSYDASLITGDSFASNGAALLVNFSGSSSASILNIDIQYSQDNINWYSIAGGSDIDNGIGSTSPSMTNPTVVTWQFASSTQDKLAITNGNSATSTRLINVDMPTRYVRAIFSIQTGAGAVWAQFIAQKQNR